MLLYISISVLMVKLSWQKNYCYYYKSCRVRGKLLLLWPATKLWQANLYSLSTTMHDRTSTKAFDCSTEYPALKLTKIHFNRI